MTEQSRRKFLKATSIGGAAAGAAILLPRLAAQPTAGHAAQDQAAAATAEAGPTHAGPFVAYVKNAKSGEIAVMVGEREVVHRDAQLAAQLAKVAGRAPQA